MANEPNKISGGINTTEVKETKVRAYHDGFTNLKATNGFSLEGVKLKRELLSRLLLLLSLLLPVRPQLGISLRVRHFVEAGDWFVRLNLRRRFFFVFSGYLTGLGRVGGRCFYGFPL